MKHSLLVAFVAIMVLASAARGGDDDSTRPTQAELSSRLEEEISSLTDEQADCVAESLLASDLSDEVLSQAERNADDDEDEAAFTEEIQKASQSCAGTDTPSPTTAAGG